MVSISILIMFSAAYELLDR